MGTKYLAHVISLRNKSDTSFGPISFNTLLIPIVLERWGRWKTVALFTEERKENGWIFSEGYYESVLMVAVPVSNNDINGIDDLTADMKVAAQTGTTGAAAVQELYDNGKIK